MAASSESKDEEESFEEPAMTEVAAGLAIISMSMRDATQPTALWQDDSWDATTMWTAEHEAHLPASLLECSAVARTVDFSSVHAIPDLSLEQTMLLHGQEVEKVRFEFGFVIPGSRNSWEQTIVAASKDRMLPADVLSGNLVVRSTFFSGTTKVGTTHVRIFYDA